MSGIADHNYPAFDAQDERLTAAGHTIFSPANHSRAFGYADEAPAALVDSILSDWDIDRVKECDVIYMLHGWERSTGARAEHALGVWLRKQFFYEDTV